ncbi:hypothetical protein [Alkalihalobacillus trypoxylicola]|uniref:Uncharacterized protein n=1 Tax=Alkalihalobacillus trypoxylicola TaxID=519424 RepID=A0A162EF31_9BACI|nr:hypothetical protein [Alkalihalobacillus trypoxylicola]KYG32421.1 hypothetical protein AZF04_06580 [Alkalihalobacillus trypoxylicola]
MSKLIVNQIKKQDNKAILILEHEVEEAIAIHLKDGERMLVDSDNQAFIYILEDTEQYFYLVLQHDLWLDLANILKEKTAVHIQLNEQIMIELKQIHHEFEFLLDNIKGNGNYAIEFEQNVVKSFT